MKIHQLINREVKAVEVVYCTNYNGAYLIVRDEDGDYDENDVIDDGNLIEDIVGEMANDCDEDGYYNGTLTSATAVITPIVQRYLGSNVVVNVVFDDQSS